MSPSIKGDISCFLWFLVISLLVWCWMCMLNMVKVPKHEVNMCKNAPWMSKARASACSECFVFNVTSTSSSWWHQIVRTRPQTAICSVAFVAEVVAKVVPQVARVVPSHISDRIQARTCTDVFEKLTFRVKNAKKKWNPTTICLHSVSSHLANQNEKGSSGGGP